MRGHSAKPKTKQLKWSPNNTWNYWEEDKFLSPLIRWKNIREGEKGRVVLFWKEGKEEGKMQNLERSGGDRERERERATEREASVY
jgi:hypothetical protein